MSRKLTVDEAVKKAVGVARKGRGIGDIADRAWRKRGVGRRPHAGWNAQVRSSLSRLVKGKSLKRVEWGWYAKA